MRKASAPTCAVRPKLWLMRADIDNGIATFKSTSNVDDIRLSCDCTCQDCKAMYNSYIDEKSMTKVLQERLDDNQVENAFMIEQVQLMENKYNAQIEELQQMVDDKQRKIGSINAQLETERKLRMEDMYKLEFQKEENTTQAKELREIRQLLNNAHNALPNLEYENKLLKQRAKQNEDTIAKMDAELHQYSYELAKLEDTNTRLRVRLHSADMQVDQYRLDNSMLSGQGGNAQALRPIKTLRAAGSQVMSASRSSKSSISINRINH